MKYVIVELQTIADGSVQNIVTVKDNRNDAESVYHSVLAAAAISDLPAHAAVLLTSEGQLLRQQCYGETASGWEES